MRELPYGENPKNSKKGIYRIADPFMNFYFTFIVNNLSRLELNLSGEVFKSIEDRLTQYVSREWENLCRRSVPVEPLLDNNYDIAGRWWGLNTLDKPMEIDVIAESTDKESLLVGECKWSATDDIDTFLEQLALKAQLLPFARDKKIVPILFLKDANQKKGANVILPGEVMRRNKV